MLLSKCVVCDRNKLRFIKEQEDSGLLSIFSFVLGVLRS